MKFVQTLPLAAMSISLYTAVFHVYMYVKNIGDRTNLSFAGVCLYMALLQFICFMNYNVTIFSHHLFWVKFFYFTFPLFPISFIHFAYDFTGQSSRRIPWILTASALLSMSLMFALFMPQSGEKPVFIPIEMLDFTYVAFQGSPMLEGVKALMFIAAYAITIYGLILIARHYRSGNPAAGPILIGALLFFVCGVNDTLIETGVYASLYLGEYGGLFLILGMTIALIRQMAKTHREISRTRVLTAIGCMATEVVHDLTSPLDAIKLAASIARKDKTGSDLQDRYLTLIEQETRRLSDLSFDILQFVNTNGRLSKQTVLLKYFMHPVCLLLEGYFKEKGIRFRYNPEYDGPVHLDPDAFKRIITNLAANAREILMSDVRNNRDPKFEIGVQKQGKRIVFSFRDNGPGIPDHIRPHIFEPFTTYGKSYGTGLGLAISKQIADRHGGTLSCESDKITGTIFHLSLPAKPH